MGLSHGPLQGLRVLELAGLGPASFAAMLLADMGADVVRVVRPGHKEMEKGATLRGRTQVELDLRNEQGKASILRLATHADALIEGFRPGVMERLGLGPETLHAVNPRLVYGRMTGWGQTGPRAPTAGHDIDYIAITGALHCIGGDEPAVPLNLLGDYGGGALYLAMGTLAGVLHARASGRGQVVDCAICDGAVSLLSLMHGLRHIDRWKDERQSNVLDGAAPFYRTYECKDGFRVAVGAIEPQFFALLLRGLGIDGRAFGEQNDRSMWQAQSAHIAAAFRSRPRSEWLAIFNGSDACVAPVNTLSGSLQDEHLLARGAFVEVSGERQPAPAPRFDRTPSVARGSVAAADVEEVCAAWGAVFPG